MFDPSADLGAFTPEFRQFCKTSNLDPTSVGSVARFNTCRYEFGIRISNEDGELRRGNVVDVHKKDGTVVVIRWQGWHDPEHVSGFAFEEVGDWDVIIPTADIDWIEVF